MCVQGGVISSSYPGVTSSIQLSRTNREGLNCANKGSEEKKVSLITDMIVKTGEARYNRTVGGQNDENRKKYWNDYGLKYVIVLCMGVLRDL
jgi:hypothetical protein